MKWFSRWEFFALASAFFAGLTAFLGKDLPAIQAINQARQYIIDYMKKAQATPIKMP